VTVIDLIKRKGRAESASAGWMGLPEVTEGLLIAGPVLKVNWISVSVCLRLCLG
jgi:hypothetical protein